VLSRALSSILKWEKIQSIIRQEGRDRRETRVKVLSAWTSVLEYLIFYVVGAPSEQAVEDHFKETGFAFWNGIAIRQVTAVEDVVNRLCG